MENLHYWNKIKQVPQEALKEIKGGRLRGMSDISPQWRYEKLTETFGICGFGWKYTIDKLWNESYQNGEIASFASISFYVKIDDNWSDAIPANGGSMFVANESKGPFVSDECYKMAITDAIGTAAKMIGLASDVYMGKSHSTNPIPPQTKYAEKPSQQNYPQNQNDERPWLNKADFDKASDYLRSGGDIEVIKKKYKISKDMMSNLLTVTKNL
jgi:hypothetical protein